LRGVVEHNGDAAEGEGVVTKKPLLRDKQKFVERDFAVNIEA
jgi:hypothetical protein